MEHSRREVLALKLEVHCHTKYSHDSLLGFTMLYWKCLIKKIEYIAITEHNNLDGAIAFERFCQKKGGRIHVIKGEEIFTTEGEVIGLYLKKEISSGMSPESTINQIVEQCGVVYIPHPYDEKRYKTVRSENAIARNSSKIDCIECHNGRNVSDSFDVEQNKIAEKYGKKKVIGSDAHTIIEIGRNYMDVSIAPVDRETFLEAIENSVLHKKKCIKFAHQTTKIVRVVKMIREGNIGEICRIFNRKIKL